MQKTPSKPKPTAATTGRLASHYNSQVDAYNAAILAMDEKKRPETGLQSVAVSVGGDDYQIGGEPITRKDLLVLIRRQNHRLKRHIKRRALELLYEKVREVDRSEVETENAELVRDDKSDAPLLLKDGKYTVGRTYQDILAVLLDEFPEASTTVACLRWYVVHEREEAVDQGKPWPDLPQVRPRSPSRRETSK